jgi:isoquinoline 1-oxidoreductase beta subunit
MAVTSRLSRRQLLVGAGALLVPLAPPAGAQLGPGQEITDWIAIAPDGEITLGLSQPEVGQGSYTVLPQILADELDADWSRVTVRFVTGRAAYRIAFKNEPPVQKEGASMSTTVLYSRLRNAGAMAREVLVRAAAQRWGVPPAECRTERSLVIHRAHRSLAYGALASDAAKLPLDPAAPLKNPAQLTLVGKRLHRLDTPAKSTGAAIFGIDVDVPGMLHAALASVPSFTASLHRIANEAEILAMPGVRAVLRLPAVDVANEVPGSQHPPMATAARYTAACVVADHFWQAKRAADAMQLVFTERVPVGGGERLSTPMIEAQLAAALEGDRAVTAVEVGRPRDILRESGRSVIERRFVVPHVAHAPLEPVNATALYKDGTVEVWGPIQAVAACQDAVAASLGCPPDAVKVNVTFLGGSFGRKIVPDYVVQAAHASKAVGRPVKLIRTREQDLRHGIFRVNAGARLRAVLDDRGYPLAVQARVAGQSLFGATRRNWLDRTPEGEWDESMVDGLYNQSYRVPNLLVETVDTPLPVPVYFMRSVGSTAAVFFWESFISELAHRAGIDQYRYRRDLLAHDPLALRVLDAAAEAAGWGRPAKPGSFRGISYNCYIGRGGRFKTHVAQVVELVPDDSNEKLKVETVTCAVDAGLVVNPNTLEAQIQGGIGFALTTALHSRITFANGGAEQANFDTYPLLTIAEMPYVRSIVLPSERPPQGFGEVVLAPLAPAIAQALLVATGRRIDVMPLPAEAFARPA